MTNKNSNLSLFFYCQGPPTYTLDGIDKNKLELKANEVGGESTFQIYTLPSSGNLSSLTFITSEKKVRDFIPEPIPDVPFIWKLIGCVE